MHMHKLPFKFNDKHGNSVCKTTSSMKNRTAHRGQSTGTSKEILNNSFSNNITTTDSKSFCMIGRGFFSRSIRIFYDIVIAHIGDSFPNFRHSDKQAIQHTSKQKASEKKANGKERAIKTARVKWGRGKREANGK